MVESRAKLKAVIKPDMWQSEIKIFPSTGAQAWGLVAVCWEGGRKLRSDF